MKISNQQVKQSKNRFAMGVKSVYFIFTFFFVFVFLLPAQIWGQGSSKQDLERLIQKINKEDNAARNYLTVSPVVADSSTKQKLIIDFQIAINPLYHINSFTPLDEFLIPTQLVIDEHPQVEKSILDYPEGEVRKLRPDIETLVSLYEKNVTIQAEVFLRTEGDINNDKNIKNNKNNKNINLSYQLNYQPCTDEICYPPVSYRSNIIVNLLELQNGEVGEFESANHSGILAAGWTFLIFAFIGGFLLNFMPCVLPVVSLKLFSLAQLRKESPTVVRRHLGFYLLGAMFTFLMLGGSVIVLKSLGKSVGWGFQFQNPYYLILMVVVLFVIAVSLLAKIELFTFGLSLGSGLGSGLTVDKNLNSNNLTSNNLTSNDDRFNPPSFFKEAGNHFFLGFLLVVLATPCIAPFLGVAAGFALSQSNDIIILFYTTLALGFLLPYLIFFINPKLIKIVPKPGRFLGWFKEILAFPLLATVIWLLSILAKVTTMEISFWILSLLLIVSIILFAYQKIIPLHKVNWKNRAFLLFFVLNLTLVFISYLPVSQDELKQSNQSDSSESKKLGWHSFSPAKIKELLAEDKIIFLHFTADWCLNCKVNEKLVLDQPATLKLFEEYQVEKMIADWTKENQEIFNEIKRLGRAGIPLDVIYYQDQVHILGEIFTYDGMKEILKKILIVKKNKKK